MRENQQKPLPEIFIELFQKTNISHPLPLVTTSMLPSLASSTICKLFYINRCNKQFYIFIYILPLLCHRHTFRGLSSEDFLGLFRSDCCTFFWLPLGGLLYSIWEDFCVLLLFRLGTGQVSPHPLGALSC